MVVPSFSYPARLVNNQTFSIDDFPSVPSAVDWLRGQEIFPNDDLKYNSVIRLTLGAGIYNLTKSLIIDHVYAPYLFMEGRPLISVPAPNAATASGSSGAFTITMTTVSAHGLSVGSVVGIRDLDGTGRFHVLEGCYKVLTVPSSTTFTYLCTAIITTIGTLTISTGTIVQFTSILSWTGTEMRLDGDSYPPYTSDPGAFDIRSGKFRLKNVALISDGADLDGCGIIARFQDSVSLVDCGINGFGKNGIICLFNSYVYGLRVYVSGCGLASPSAAGDGVAAQLGGTVNITDLVSSNNGQSGARSRDAATALYLTEPRLFGNKSGALTAEGWSRTIAASSVIAYNSNVASNGDVRVEKGAVMDIRESTVISEASAYGLLIRDGGQMYVDDVTVSGAATKDIRVDGGHMLYGTAPTFTSFGITSGWVKNAFYQNTADWAVVDTNAAFTLTPLTSRKHQVHTGTLTADRDVTLSTTSVSTGMEWIIYRLGGGAFNLNVGTGPLKAMVQGDWARFVYDGAAWVLAANGTI